MARSRRRFSAGAPGGRDRWARTIGIAAVALVAVALAPSARSAPTARIAFVEQPLFGPVGALVVVRSDGTRARRIVRFGPRAPIADPAWSPGGERIAWIARGTDLVTARADGTDVRRLLRVRSGRLSAPSWAPDGASIRFVRTVEARECGVATRVASVLVDGSGYRVLARPVLPANEYGCRSDVAEPTWRHDGAALAFSYATGNASNHCGNESRIAVLSLESRAVRMVSGEPAPACSGDEADIGPDDTAPTWMPGGRRIVFARDLRTLAVEVSAQVVRLPTRVERLGLFGRWNAAGEILARPTGAGVEAVTPTGTRRLVFRTREPVDGIAILG